MSNRKKSILLILLILLIDQTLKFWIKTHLAPGGEIVIFKNWFILHFIENNGMAFGLEFGNHIGKYFLSIFRLIAIGLLGWYLQKLLKREAPFGLIACFSMIMAGAIGNMIDGAFYGMIFNYNPGEVATLFPADGGYSSFMMGRVVDMFYFPLIETTYPGWVPFLAGQDLIFFRHIFNVADSAVSIGVFSIFIFHRHHFGEEKKIENEGEPKTGDNLEPKDAD
ncbi:MAG: lipoprotein signal peptidase [Bacteroidota bacterium]